MQVVIVEIDAVLRSTGAAAPLYLSDIGYISLPTDPGGPVCYLPHLQQPLNDQSEMPISPESSSTISASWGDIVAFNPRDASGVGFYDGLLDTVAVAGRAVTVMVGEKTFDRVRGIWIDPAISTFTTVFQGVALDWEQATSTTADTISISIRDNLSVLDQPTQTNFYDGSGGALGTDDIAGQPIPKLRGICQNITPVLVDPTHLIYQVSDSNGIHDLTVYEGGGGSWAASGTDYATYALLAANAPAAGHYHTCLTLGYFRLAAQPIGVITCDATGGYPSGFSFTPFNLALYMIAFESGYAGSIDVASFTALDALYPYNTGVYTGTDAMTWTDMVDQLMAGVGGAIGCNLSGEVAAFQLSAPSGSPVFTWDTSQIIDCQPVDLPDSVTIPNWRRTLGYNRLYTTQNSNFISPITNARIQALANEYAKVTWSNGAVKTRYPTAQDVPMTASQLLTKADAQAMVNAFGALWGTQRYLYDLTLPRALLSSLQDFGTVGQVTYPCGKLAGGALVVAVGHERDLQSDRVVQRVLV